MAKNLLIVESPAKAKTIEKYLGKDFKVVSSFGHIRDLEKGGMGIDIDNGFVPRYKVSDDKQRVVADLKSKAKAAEEVWLATDEDREGEAISWHLCEVLDLEPKTTKRIVFHEITKEAIRKAVESPRTVDLALVDAQQARRIVDRLVGFELSPVLWRKLSGARSLSAGRVQSVAVKLLAEREKEIIEYKPTFHYKMEAHFSAKDHTGRAASFKAEGKKINTFEDAKSLLEQCVQAEFSVADIHVRPGKQTPSAPFTTSTLQQEASRKLGYSVSRTMRVAQTLYENGYITYMRTDSVSLSETAMNAAEETIKKSLGEEYHQRRKYKNKNDNAQEAHEAIRPTEMGTQKIPLSDAQSLYNLIWKRTMASQMADAKLEKTTATIAIKKEGQVLDQNLQANGEVVVFDGFLRVYFEGKDDDSEVDTTRGSLLPPLKVGMSLPLLNMTATQRFSRPSPRFTEASLVKKLEELGIGRPSTYAPTISTIQNRGYVEKKELEGKERNYKVIKLEENKVAVSEPVEVYGREKSKLFPTDLGMVVTDFLSEHFERVMDYGFTAKIEGLFDEIASGKQVWNSVVQSFYNPFHERVEEVMEHAERAKGERVLGEDPETGKPVIARLGRFGPMVQIGEAEQEEKPKFASLRPNQSILNITLEEALELFKLPYDLGEFQDKVMTIGVGRFGPYVKWNDIFVSIPKGEDPLIIEESRAVELIEEKLKADAPIATFKGLPVTKGKGRFGPYLKWDAFFINVPKRYDFENLSIDDINELIQAKIEKEANRYIHRWPDLNLAVENGRWGPFIKFGKKNVKLINKESGKRMEQEEAKELTLEQVKALVEAEIPNAFKAKKAKKAKKVKKAKRKATASKSKAE